MDTTELVKRYVALHKSKQDAENNLDDIKTQMEELEGQIVDDFIEKGIQNLNVDGVTVFKKTELNVYKKPESEGITTEDVLKALKDCGLDYMVSETYSASSLKGKIREYESQGIEVPTNLSRVIVVSKSLKLSCRKS